MGGGPSLGLPIEDRSWLPFSSENACRAFDSGASPFAGGESDRLVLVA